jgi:hypothetical protein
MHNLIVKKRTTIDDIKLSRKNFASFAFILFFNAEPIYSMLKPVLEWISLPEIRGNLTALIILIPMLLLIVSSRNSLPVDFFFLLFTLVVFFLITYLLHPEYKYVFMRPIDGVWDGAFRPDQGLYAYYFIRIFDNPKDIKRNLKIVAFTRLAFHIFEFYLASNRGYWVIRNAAGQMVEKEYGLGFGYELLFPTLIFGYHAIREANVKNMLLSLVGATLMLIAGSRGQFICIAIFLVIMLFTYAKPKKLVLCGSVLLLAAIFIVFIGWDVISNTIISLLERFNVPSRTLNMLITGTIGITSGRDILWGNAVSKIQENPFGYGFMGDRHFQVYTHFSGYSHDIFLELWIDFGVIVGTGIILILLIGAIKMLFCCKDDDWRGLFIIFFSVSCQLIMSKTFWRSPYFWAAIAITVSYNFIHKKMSKHIKEKS